MGTGREAGSVLDGKGLPRFLPVFHLHRLSSPQAWCPQNPYLRLACSESPGRGRPSNRLTRNRGDGIEVLIVVNQWEPSRLRTRRDDEVGVLD